MQLSQITLDRKTIRDWQRNEIIFLKDLAQLIEDYEDSISLEAIRTILLERAGEMGG